MKSTKTANLAQSIYSKNQFDGKDFHSRISTWTPGLQTLWNTRNLEIGKTWVESLFRKSYEEIEDLFWKNDIIREFWEPKITTFLAKSCLASNIAKKFWRNSEPFFYLFLIVFRIIHCISRLAFGKTEVTDSEDLIFFWKVHLWHQRFFIISRPNFWKISFGLSFINGFKIWRLCTERK